MEIIAEMWWFGGLVRLSFGLKTKRAYSYNHMPVPGPYFRA